MVSRIHFITLFSLVLLSMMGEAESLVSFAMNIRQKGFWGVLAGRTPKATSIPTLTMEPVSSSIQDDVGGFDPDAYRRQMTDLVYQRSLDRFSSQ